MQGKTDGAIKIFYSDYGKVYFRVLFYTVRKIWRRERKIWPSTLKVDGVPLFMSEHYQYKIFNSLAMFPSLTVEHWVVSKSEFVRISLQQKAGYVKSVQSSRVN